MTLSLLIYVLMIATLASLAAVLVADAVRDLRRAPAPKPARAERRPARSRGAAPTTS